MATSLRFRVLPGCDAARFGVVSTALLREVEAGGPPTLLVAALTGEALLLGRHQRASSALSLDSLPSGLAIARRAGGGRTIAAGEGRIGVALALPDAGALLSGPIGADKVINRYVRGLNVGLTACGAGTGAHYFGRDFVSSEGRQIAVVSQDGLPGGAVLFEAIVAVERPLELPPGARGYPAHGDPRADGPPHGTLAELWKTPHAFSAIAEAIARGYERVYGCTLPEISGSSDGLGGAIASTSGGPRARPPGVAAAGLLPTVNEEETGFEESGVADIPIGFVEALVKVDGDRVAEARLRGDFVAPSFVVRELERELAGKPLEFTALGTAVDEAFRRPGAALLGVVQKRIFPEAILAAAGRL